MKLRELLEVIPLANQNISIWDEEWENDYFRVCWGYTQTWNASQNMK